MEWLNVATTVAALAATIVGGVIVALGNIFLNSKGVTLNVQKAANEAATAVVADMRDLITELKSELDRKDVIISKLSDQVNHLEGQIEQLRADMKSDTAKIIKQVNKH